MDVNQFQSIVNFIWSVADDLLRDVYTKSKYRDIILPMTIIRRIDALLEPKKDEAIKIYNQYKDQIQNLDTFPIVKELWGGGINYSQFTLQTLLNDPKNIRINFENYLDCFTGNIKDIISKFKFKNQLDTLEEANILFGVIERFCSPKVNFSIKDILDEKGNIIHKGLSNLGMGYIFEELIRKFNEENNEEAGEHFTPIEIIELMTHLVFLPVKEQIKQGTYLVYDNACGSGRILAESKEFITDSNGFMQSNANIYLYGQEINPEAYAICKANMLIKGEDPNHIKFGSTLSNDQQNLKFDFMLSNPPYGRSWENDQKILGVEKKGFNSSCNDPRFNVGITSKSDGQMMFLLNMLSKMKFDTSLGSRIASVHNSSSLFNSDSGMVAIRKHIIENDYLEAIIALPTNIFYNTAIPTFIWIITNKKPEYKKGKVQLINAANDKYFSKMKKSLGFKQNEMSKEHIGEITKLFLENISNEDCKIYDNEDFGYTKIIIEKPKSIEVLKDDEKFKKLKDKEKILEKLKILEQNTQDFKNRKEFIDFLGVKLKKSEENLIIDSDKNNNTEKIPLKINIQSYYDTEVKPYIKNSWIAWDSASVGYEILFNRYFYTYTPLRKLDEINNELKELEKKIQDLLSEIM
ncbi:N-6 DNA methylase [Campylobacter hepaticus]